MEIDNVDVRITILLKEQPHLIANATVSLRTTIFGFVTIKGFQIWKSPRFNDRLQEAINITPPTKQIFGKYFHQVFFENPKEWIALESRIYDVFNKARSENSKKLPSENVSPDELVGI